MLFNRKFKPLSKPSEFLKNTDIEKNSFINTVDLQQCKRMLNCFVLLERINPLDFSSNKKTETNKSAVQYDKKLLLTSSEASYFHVDQKPYVQNEVYKENLKTKELIRNDQAFNCVIKPTIKAAKKLDTQSVNNKKVQRYESKEDIECKPIGLFPFINNNIHHETVNFSAFEKVMTVNVKYKNLPKPNSIQNTLNEINFSKKMNILMQSYKILNCFVLLERINPLDFLRNKNDNFAVCNPCTQRKYVPPSESCDSYKEPSNLEKSIPINVSNTIKPECKSCNIQHIDEIEFSKHILSHKRKNGYVCILCTKHFFDKSLLKKHMLVHSERNSFTCAICYKSLFTKTDVLKEKCTNKKVLYSKETLKTHLYLHENVG